MNKREIRQLQSIGKEILKLEAVALKLKGMGTDADLPVVIYNINRILGSINVLKQNISDPLRIVYSRTAVLPADQTTMPPAAQTEG